MFIEAATARLGAKLLKIGIGVAVVLFVLWACYNRGVTGERARLTALHDAELSKLREGHALALADAEGNARAKEHAAQQAIADIDREHTERAAHAKQQADAVIADLRAGTRRLRFQCPAPTAAGAGMPGTTASAGVGDAAAAGGLQPEDAGFLVREAERADQIAHQLQACQAIVRTYTKMSDDEHR